MSEHLKDFVWMQKSGGKPVKVEADPAVISRHMVAGYSQVDPPEIETKEE